MAVLGLHFCARAFSSCGKWGPLFITVHRPLTIAASLVVEHRLQMCKLSNFGSRAQLLCGMWILPDQGSNPCPLHWQADSQSLHHHGSPRSFFDWVFLFLFVCLFVLLLSSITCLNILEISPLSVASFANIFSHSVGCLFILFMVSFAVQNLVSLIRSYLFIFVFISIALGD